MYVYSYVYACMQLFVIFIAYINYVYHKHAQWSGNTDTDCYAVFFRIFLIPYLLKCCYYIASYKELPFYS